MLRATYDWVIGLAAHPRAIWALAAISFIESSVFPIPPDVLLIPMVLAARERAFQFALVCTIASVLGGLAGYAIGYFLFEGIGRDIVALYGQEAAFEAFRGVYAEWGAWIVAGAGITPFPYKVITIASGVVQMDVLTFVLASVASRGARFVIEAALLWYIGPPIRHFVEHNLVLVTTAFFAILVGGFVLVRFVF